MEQKILAVEAAKQPLPAVLRDAELKDIADAFHRRLLAAGLQCRQMVSVVTHMVTMLTESMARERRDDAAFHLGDRDAL